MFGGAVRFCAKRSSTPAAMASDPSAVVRRTSRLVGDMAGSITRGLMSERRLISSGSTFETDIAYSRAVVQGDWVFVSGTTGFDYETMTISPNLMEQTEQCLKNIAAALHEAHAGM